MFKPRISNKRTGIFFIFFLLILLWPLVSGASPELISDRDLDDSDPVEFTSRIMEIDYGKAVLVVAEHTVMTVDLMIGDEQYITRVTGPQGKVISFDSLHTGQKVLVRGLKLADGRVVASMVQQLGSGHQMRRLKRFVKPTPLKKSRD
ncbi:MAG: hypothetical protein WBM69_23090 [Desulfobacterales bacterium]